MFIFLFFNDNATSRRNAELKGLMWTNDAMMNEHERCTNDVLTQTMNTKDERMMYR